MNARQSFYQNSVATLITDRNATILVCGGGPLDKEVFEQLGFQNVTISNLDSRRKGDMFAPFPWKYENAESLSFSNESFDYVVIHAAIHHSSSPHKVLTEMYRVAKLGLLAFESRDSIIMHLLEKYGLTYSYEHAAVYYNDCKYGGVNNTEIPNYVYRWSEREIEKTIQSYAPCFKHTFAYKYGTAFPAMAELENKGKWKLYLLKFMSPLYKVFIKFFPKQQNLFAFYIAKPLLHSKSLFPWLLLDKKGNSITFNREWGDNKYKRIDKLSA
jgi:SAM-dependent methyltransferase